MKKDSVIAGVVKQRSNPRHQPGSKIERYFIAARVKNEICSGFFIVKKRILS